MTAYPPYTTPSSSLSPEYLFLGNDIVCLSTLSPRAKKLDPYYLKKIFTPDEENFILKAQEPVKMLANFWALKEASYKVYIQLSGKRFFGPKGFSVQRDKKNPIFQIHTPKGCLYGIVKENKDYVHAICSTSKTVFIQNWEEKVMFLKNLQKENQSQVIKSYLIQEVASLLNVSPQELSISYAQSGIPIIQRQEKNLSIRISISHDGPWGAFIFRRVEF